MRRLLGLAAVLAGGYLLASCGKPSAPNAGGAQASTGGAVMPPAQAASRAPAARPEEPFRLATVFPPGRGREKVLNACGSCHALVCVTRGQRTAERWENIKASHRDKLTDAGSGDLDEMFLYLKTNFNETRPEPRVPAELLQQGCTPF
jgi:hypothetical protein